MNKYEIDLECGPCLLSCLIERTLVSLSLSRFLTHHSSFFYFWFARMIYEFVWRLQYTCNWIHWNYLACACFTGAAIVARRRKFLYLGGLFSSGLSILFWLHFATSVFGYFAAAFNVKVHRVKSLIAFGERVFFNNS